MKLSVDVTRISGYIAGGGLLGVAGVISIFFPKYSAAANAILGPGGFLIAIAGLIGAVKNPTPTNTVQVFDRTTGSTVDIKTVAAPTGEPTPPPTYTADPSPVISKP